MDLSNRSGKGSPHEELCNESVQCQHPGCNQWVESSYAYACGELLEPTAVSCGGFFCEMHRRHWIVTGDQRVSRICNICNELLLDSGQWQEYVDEGVLVRRIAESYHS